jgi:hypothetical protein
LKVGFCSAATAKKPGGRMTAAKESKRTTGPRKTLDKNGVVKCERSPGTALKIERYAKEIKKIAPSIGDHGLSEEEFWDSRIFHSAIEKIRGTRSSSMQEKKEFVTKIVNLLEEKKLINSHEFTGSRNRHDYLLRFPKERQSVIEAKGCLDGNNTTIFTRPPNADEFVIWSLCQNPGADPKHNIWSGIHTRLGAKIVAEKVKVDALVVWDMLCGTPLRRCPKPKTDKWLQIDKLLLPPPCIYLFPRTIPDPRDNKKPAILNLKEVSFASALNKLFGGTAEIVNVHIEVDNKGADVIRKTTLESRGKILVESSWTKLKRTSQ